MTEIKGPGGILHGGDVGAAARRFGRPAADWLDLSTGINAVSYAPLDVSAEAWARLPRAEDLARLKEVAAAAYGAPTADWICAAPGTQSLIQRLPQALNTGRVAVLGPTYAEHAAAWRAAGAEVTMTSDLPARDRSLVLVNPNNPDGRAVDPRALLDWARKAASAGHWLVVDEAFADVRPDISLIRLGLPGNAVVLRSFGKFYGLAGLRLGFAVAAPALAARLAACLGPWAVPGPALEIGARALGDRAWAVATRARLAADADRLRALLAARLGATGGAVVGGTDLYVYLDHPAAGALADHLGAWAVLVRRFDFDPRKLRFGLPGAADGWRRLDEALSTFAVPAAQAVP